MINDYPSAQVAVRSYNDALNTELATIQAASARLATLRQAFTASWPGLQAPQTPGEQHVADVTAQQIASGQPLTDKQVAAQQAQNSADVTRIGGEVTRPQVVNPVVPGAVNPAGTPLSSQQAAQAQRDQAARDSASTNQRKTGIL